MIQDETYQTFDIVVRRDTGHIDVIPPVKTTDEIDAIDVAVRQMNSAMETSAIQHNMVVIPTDNHQIDVVDQRRDRHSVRNLAPFRNLDWLHATRLRIGPTRHRQTV